MTKYVFPLICLIAVLGCSSSSDRVFVHVGGGSSVPAESIDLRVKESGLTREQVVEQMRLEHFDRRVQKHAEKYGLMEDEARQQLAYAEEHESVPLLKMPVGTTFSSN